jgi:SAM-dependent methyltransferase
VTLMRTAAPIVAMTGATAPACAICGNQRENRTHLAREMMFGFRDVFRYLECSTCGCVQLLDVPIEMSKYYPKAYYSFAAYRGLRAGIKRRWAVYAYGRWNLVGWLAAQLLGPFDAMVAVRRADIPTTATILDVGCGSGQLIRDMKRLGYQRVTGVDPYIEHDLHYDDGVTVLRRTLDATEGTYDVVMLHHSFEHMSEPARAMREVRRLLKPDGRVLLRIPIADSFAWQHYGVNWIGLDPPRHLFLHSPASIERLSRQAGLRVTGLVYEGNASQFLGSEQIEAGIPLEDPRSIYSPGFRRLYGWWRARRLRGRIDELNRSGRGDWACFELRPGLT